MRQEGWGAGDVFSPSRSRLGTPDWGATPGVVAEEVTPPWRREVHPSAFPE